jgi:tetratricopeptide (TPR) repeat protein
MVANLFSARFAVLFCTSFLWSARAQAPGGGDAAQQQVKNGDSAFTQGDYEVARRSFEKAWQVAQGLPANSSVRYQILKRLTAAAAASGRFGEAQQYLEQAVEWHESKAGAKAPEIVEDLQLLVTLELRTRDFDRALATAQRVQAIHTATYTADSLPVSEDFLRIAQIYLAQGKPREAARALTRADGLRTRLAGLLDPGRLPILDGLCEAFRAIAGDSGTGNEALYRQALAIRETLYGEDSPELISTLEGLADAYTVAGEYGAAEPVYNRLVSLWEKLVGKDHPMVAVTLDKLVVFYNRQGQTEKARQALARSVDIRASFLAVGLSHQAADEITQEHRDKAIVLYNRALAALGSGPANEDLISGIRRADDDLISQIKKADSETEKATAK